MLKRTGWLIVFLISLGLFGLAATIDVGSALPITQSDHGAALDALPGNLLLLAKTKCPYDFCYGCEKQKVCVVWKHNDQCTDHNTSDFSCCKFWVWKKKCSCKARNASAVRSSATSRRPTTERASRKTAPKCWRYAASKLLMGVTRRGIETAHGSAGRCSRPLYRLYW